MIENRRAYRLPFRQKFTFSTDRYVITGNATNLSATGVFVTTFETNLVERDLTCSALFLLANDQEPVTIPAVIKRVIAPSANPEEVPGIAFMFVDNGSNALPRVFEFMEDCRRNFEVAATLLSQGEPDLQSLEHLVERMQLPAFADLGELKYRVEIILQAIEMVENQKRK